VLIARYGSTISSCSDSPQIKEQKVSGRKTYHFVKAAVFAQLPKSGRSSGQKEIRHKSACSPYAAKCAKPSGTIQPLNTTLSSIPEISHWLKLSKKVILGLNNVEKRTGLTVPVSTIILLVEQVLLIACPWVCGMNALGVLRGLGQPIHWSFLLLQKHSRSLANLAVIRMRHRGWLAFEFTLIMFTRWNTLLALKRP
jgi:hypothetical protein